MHLTLVRSDLQLLTRYTDTQDRTALDELFGRHYPSVYQVVRRLVTDEFAARDRTQATFLSALSAIQRGQRPDNFRSLLLKIAVNEVRMGKRRPQPAQHDDPLFEMFAEVATESAELAAQRAEFERALETCLATMPEKLREPLVLHYYQELPLSEIGAILGCSKSTAQGRLDSAIRMLRQRFKTRGYGALVILLPEYYPALAPALEGSSLVGSTAGLLAGLGGLIMTHIKLIGGIGVVALVLLGTMQEFVLGEGLMDTVPNAPDEIVAGGRRAETTNQSEAESRTVHGQPARTTGTTVRARIIDAVTGRPIEHFWIGSFRRTEKHQFAAPRFPHFGTWHAMHDALLTLPSVREVHDAEGRVDLPTQSTQNQALFVLAHEHAVLLAFGAPFRTASASDAVEPILALQPIAHREALILDHDEEKPVVGARLTLHDTPKIDYVSRIESTLGSSALTLPTNAATGLESDLDGRLRIPLLLSMAVYTGSNAAAKSGYLVPGPFMIHKPGYAYGELTSDQLVAEDTARIFLDAQPATLRLNVVDRAGNPVRAALTIQSPSRDAFEVDTVTDAVGSCTIAGLAPGATELRIYVPAEFPGGLEPGQLVRNGILWNLKAIAGRDRRRVELRAGAVTELTHQLGSSTPTTPTAVVFGTIERPTEGTTVFARYGQESGSWNRRVLAGADYEVGVEAGLATRFKSVYDIKDGKPRIEQLFTIPALKAGQHFRLDLVPPPTHHLKRFKGHLDLEDAKNLPLPENIELKLVQSRTRLAQTPEHTLITEKTRIVDGAAFDCAVAPGVYRILGFYRTSESSSTAFEFGRVELLEDRTDAVIHIPWVSRIRVKATDVVEGRPIMTHRDGSMSWIRAADGSGTGRHRTFLSPGRYEIHYIATGYQPCRGSFEVGRTADTEVAVEMVPGQGAVFAGKVVDKRTGRPLNQSATITCDRSGDPDKGLWRELEMGRFEFRGLAAGDYVLRVQLAAEHGTSQSEFRFQVDERQERRGLVIRLDIGSRAK